MARAYTDPLDRTTWTPRLDTRLRKYRDAGLTHREIGELLGITTIAARRRLQRLGATTRHVRVWTTEDTAELIRHLKLETPYRRIAGSLNRTEMAIWQQVAALRRAGVLPPAPERRCHFPITSRLHAP